VVRKPWRIVQVFPAWNAMRRTIGIVTSFEGTPGAKRSLRSFRLMNHMVAIPTNWFQILHPVAAAMRPVLTMVNLQPPVVVAAATPPARSSQNFQTVDLVHLAHQSSQGKFIGATSRLGHQFIAAEGGICNLAAAVSVAQPPHFTSCQPLRFFWAHVFLTY
jgi:hypothetical protein